MTEYLSSGTPFQSRIPFMTYDEALLGSVITDQHMHTTYVDGADSVLKMAERAAEEGIGRILFTEHIRADSVYFPDFEKDIRNVDVSGLTAHVGVETKIMDLDGTLDLSPTFAAQCDAVVGSVHRPPPEFSEGEIKWNTLDPEVALDLEFRLSMAVITKSRAHVLGHPMGMVYRAFDLEPLRELELLAQACRKHDKVFELNARYAPNPEAWVRIVREVGCKVSISSDAHSHSELGNGWRHFVTERGGS